MPDFHPFKTYVEEFYVFFLLIMTLIEVTDKNKDFEQTTPVWASSQKNLIVSVWCFIYFLFDVNDRQLTEDKGAYTNSRESESSTKSHCGKH